MYTIYSNKMNNWKIYQDKTKLNLLVLQNDTLLSI